MFLIKLILLTANYTYNIHLFNLMYVRYLVKQCFWSVGLQMDHVKESTQHLELEEEVGESMVSVHGEFFNLNLIS